MTPPLPRVALFSLGGTIASTSDDQAGAGGVTPRLGARELVAAVPQLEGIATLDSVAFRQIASGDLTFEDLAALAGAIEKKLADGADGVVVTQGTDSIEETAFALSLLVDDPRPVVVTGAMRNPTLAGADGPANLLSAVQVACSTKAYGLGTVVVFNDEIHSARFVRKTHTSSTATFQSPTVGPLGWVVEGRARVALAPTASLPVIVKPSAEQPLPAVALLTVSLGDDGRLVDQVEAQGYRGLVLEAFGGGHVPARMVAALETLAASIPVVLASRTGAGEMLTETYGFPGSERDLLARGLIAAGALDGLKARVLLTLLLASSPDATGVHEGFARARELW